MKNFSKLLIALALTFCINTLTTAQQLMPALEGFSKKKISYITLMDGTTIEGNLKDLDRKKGLIEEVTLKGLDGKKHKLKAEKIKHMYLPPSGWSKFASTMEFLDDATQWGSTDLDQDIITKGYVYIEQSEVKIKKKTRTLLVQVLNPSFCEKIKIYNDPFAGETASIGIAGIKMAGGNEKSYYVKSKKIAYRLKKKNYDEEFKLLFQDCKSLKKKYGKKIFWEDFAKHVFEHAKECS